MAQVPLTNPGPVPIKAAGISNALRVWGPIARLVAPSSHARGRLFNRLRCVVCFRCRRVEDLQAVLHVISGRDGVDPYALRRPYRFKMEDVALGRVRVGVVTFDGA